jgi:hypothetical protein
MNQQDIKFIIGVLAHFVMDTSSITQKRRAYEIINSLGKEITHD